MSELLLSIGISAAVLVAGMFIVWLLTRFFPGLKKIFLFLLLIFFVLAARIFLTFHLLQGHLLSPWCDIFLIFLPIALLLKILDLVTIDRFLKEHKEIAVPPFIHNVFLGLLYIISFFIIIKFRIPTIKLTGIVVTSAVFSAVVGLAFQDILVNFLSGLIISLEKPFQIGDWVMVGEKDGRIADITWRTTKLRTRENDYIIIPNSIIAKERLINYYRPSRLHMVKVVVGVHYDIPPLKVKQILLRAARETGGVVESPQPEVHLQEYGDFKIDYELRIWIDEYENLPEIEDSLHTSIWYLFKRENIIIPFPIRTVHLHEAGPLKPATAEMGSRLAVIAGKEKGRFFPLADDGVMRIGRDQANEVQLTDLRVSKKHAAITGKEGGFIITDTDSAAGTFVNGVSVKEKKLTSGDEIKLAGTVFIFEKGT